MKNLTKNQKEFLFLGIGIVAIFVIFYFVKRKEANPLSEIEKTPSGSSFSSGLSFQKTVCDKNTVLQKGIECDAVMYAQRQINMIHQNLGISKLQDDGKFGQATENAFRKLVNKPTATYSEIVEARKTIKPN